MQGVIKAELIDHCGSDLSVVNAARVSFNKASSYIGDSELSDKDAKLINYLAKHKHTSPFNHCFLSFRVSAPIFVARQLVKHKFMPWNEVSRRYVDDNPTFYVPEYFKRRAENVKQGSSDEAILGNEGALRILDSANKLSLSLYREFLQQGMCPEEARMVLPLNTMTEWVWSGTLGAFAEMLKLRLASDTQTTTREVAEKIKECVEERFPVSLKALLSNP